VQGREGEKKGKEMEGGERKEKGDGRDGREGKVGRGWGMKEWRGVKRRGDDERRRGKGRLTIPILLCFRRRCSSELLPELLTQKVNKLKFAKTQNVLKARNRSEKNTYRKTDRRKARHAHNNYSNRK